MNVVFLVCDCGTRLRAPGAIPGRVGRCPNCGGQLRVPELPSPAPVGSRASADDATGPGYRLQSPAEQSLREPSRTRPADRSGPRESYLVKRPAISMTGGLLREVTEPETSALGSILYPLRAAEPLGMIAALSVFWWILLSCVFEYCLTLMRDADEMGTPTLGRFIALISILPVVFLFPFSLLYWLQYLGRVLVASAMGETRPPRTPDRNFQGFFTGISPWLIWLVLGVAVGLLPAYACAQSIGSGGMAYMLIIAALVALGLPYMIMALMMAFVHDHPLAATPWGIASAILRVPMPFLSLCFFVGFALLSCGTVVFLLMLLRSSFFWIYLILSVGGWAFWHWTAIVIMRALGNFYYHHKDVLRWNKEHLRWGVRWRL
jgi:hypothetical protein